MGKTFKNLDKPLLLVTIVLFVLGLIMVFSASNVTAYMSKAVSPYNFFIKQSAFLVAGLIISSLMINISSKNYGRISYLLMLIGIATQTLLPFFGVLRNNSKSWFDLGLVNYQPSEFMKVISIIWLAYYYDKHKNKLSSYVKVFFPIAICIASAALIFIEPDLGTMIIYSSIVGVIFLAQPIPFKIKAQTLFLGGATVGLSLLLLVGTGHSVLIERQKERINAGNPCDNLLTTGNQICNGYIAINNGGLTGLGLGNSTQKYLYLPEPYTDFIFCIIIEELGLITGLLIISSYIFILWRILLIGRKSPSNASATMCYGIAFYIFIHISVNLLGLFGIIPMTGVPLPFMSYGGSFTICLIAALTVVQRINVENNIESNN